uniref:Probable ATP-dependent RNA helicase DDX20 n=1 Tax=Phallusia mammillata TaxID=59560 RepID=A0A6F9DA50_9ASCI|nr:probable ATP-dependent RNA helicase DDX20 [Phallusia mammillata]
MLAVSATYPQALAEFLKCYMCQPQFVQLNPTDPSLLGLQQYYYVVGDQCLPHVMFEQKTQSIIELFTTSSFQQALVFSNFHSRAHSLSQALNSAGWPSTYISGNLDQPQRIVAINKLKDFKCRVLISTDLTSRGIDAYHVDLVVNMDVPLDWETYMHRIGRAGRFGSRGTAFTLIGSKREEENLLAIAAQCSAKICKLESLSFVSRKSDLSGQINNLEQQMTGLHIKTQTKSLSTEFLGYQAEPDTNGMNGHVAQQKARSHPKAKGEIQDTNVTEELALTTDESSSESDHDTPAQPLIPSLQELLQSSMHLRKNVHYRNMSHLELLADLEYFKKHGEMAPPPYREDADTRNVQAKPRSNAKAVQRTDKANGRDTSIEPVSKQLLNTSSKTTAQSSQVKAKTNGQNGSQNTGPDARRVTTNSNEKAQHARKTQERKPSPPHSRPIRRDSTCTSSTSSTEVAEGSIPYEPQVLNNPRQYQTQQAAYPVCSNYQCVSPYFVYEDDREFAAYVQRHAAWYARHYVELSYKSVLS